MPLQAVYPWLMQRWGLLVRWTFIQSPITCIVLRELPSKSMANHLIGPSASAKSRLYSRYSVPKRVSTTNSPERLPLSTSEWQGGLKGILLGRRQRRRSKRMFSSSYTPFLVSAALRLRLHPVDVVQQEEQRIFRSLPRSGYSQPEMYA